MGALNTFWRNNVTPCICETFARAGCSVVSWQTGGLPYPMQVQITLAALLRTMNPAVPCTWPFHATLHHKLGTVLASVLAVLPATNWRAIRGLMGMPCKPALRIIHWHSLLECKGLRDDTGVLLQDVGTLLEDEIIDVDSRYLLYTETTPRWRLTVKTQLALSASEFMSQKGDTRDHLPELPASLVHLVREYIYR
jgi:hypothetical protein